MFFDAHFFVADKHHLKSKRLQWQHYSSIHLCVCLSSLYLSLSSNVFSIVHQFVYVYIVEPIPPFIWFFHSSSLSVTIINNSWSFYQVVFHSTSVCQSICRFVSPFVRPLPKGTKGFPFVCLSAEIWIPR